MRKLILLILASVLLCSAARADPLVVFLHGQHGSGIQTSCAHLQEIAPDALWLGAERFYANTSPAELSAWCVSIGLE